MNMDDNVMSESEIQILLDEKAAKELVLSIRREQVAAECQGMIPVDVKVAMAMKAAALKKEEAPVVEELESLTKRLTEGVLALAKTVKGGSLQAVWYSGKTTWDNKKLQGYAEAHPEIKSFRKVGDPYVSITKTKDGK
jgi:hypothetical protein